VKATKIPLPLSVTMDEATVKKIHEARRYLSSLPDTLPATGPESSANALLSFSLNPEWVEDIGMSTN